MKTLYYPEFNKLEVTEQPVPEIAANEVLLEVAACGICGSELESFAHQSAKRTPPIIMGHEFCGIISEVGEAVRGFKTGDRVVSNALVSCGQCGSCLRGETNLCPNREVFSIHRNGAFAEYVNVPAGSLLPMPDSLTYAEACLAEPLANGVHLVGLTKHIAGKQILVIGAGPIGLMALQAFRVLREATCYVSDINIDRLKVAKTLGAVRTLNPKTDDVEALLKDLTHQEGIDIVIDAVGNPMTTATALRVLRPGGALLLIGLQQNTQVLNSYELILPEKQVIGSYAATREDMETAIRLIAEGQVDVHSWVHTYPLEDGVRGFKDMLAARDGHIKSILLPK